MSQPAWWRGARGEWYVVLQTLLFVLVLVGPGTWSGWTDWVGWEFRGNRASLWAGAVLVACGAGLAIAGVRKFGPRLTALPYPAEGGTLLDTGPYRLVRHPIYSGVILVAFGWACWRQGWLTFVYATLLFLFLDIKARREEQWLLAKFSTYGDYRRRVRKLVPFVY
jgi:protein-S-isoprenylcysteine O-methyltransferase Ste14